MTPMGFSARPGAQRPGRGGGAGGGGGPNPNKAGPTNRFLALWGDEGCFRGKGGGAVGGVCPKFGEGGRPLFPVLRGRHAAVARDRGNGAFRGRLGNGGAGPRASGFFFGVQKEKNKPAPGARWAPPKTKGGPGGPAGGETGGPALGWRGRPGQKPGRGGAGRDAGKKGGEGGPPPWEEPVLNESSSPPWIAGPPISERPGLSSGGNGRLGRGERWLRLAFCRLASHGPSGGGARGGEKKTGPGGLSPQKKKKTGPGRKGLKKKLRSGAFLGPVSNAENGAGRPPTPTFFPNSGGTEAVDGRPGGGASGQTTVGFSREWSLTGAQAFFLGAWRRDNGPARGNAEKRAIAVFGFWTHAWGKLGGGMKDGGTGRRGATAGGGARGARTRKGGGRSCRWLVAPSPGRPVVFFVLGGGGKGGAGDRTPNGRFCVWGKAANLLFKVLFRTDGGGGAGRGGGPGPSGFLAGPGGIQTPGRLVPLPGAASPKAHGGWGNREGRPACEGGASVHPGLSRKGRGPAGCRFGGGLGGRGNGEPGRDRQGGFSRIYPRGMWGTGRRGDGTGRGGHQGWGGGATVGRGGWGPEAGAVAGIGRGDTGNPRLSPARPDRQGASKSAGRNCWKPPQTSAG